MPIKPKKNVTPKEALLRLQELCNRGEYCTWELSEKLRKWSVPESTARKIIMLLERHRLVDDHRYAEALAHTKAIYNHWGKHKIHLYLRSKHICAQDIADALDKIDDEAYFEALKSVVASKKRQLGEDASTYEGRCKIYRYAASKGYESKLILEAMKSSF